MVRNQFKDIKGSSELAMLAAPSSAELNADNLTDQQIQKIAVDAEIDSGIFAIFINGYALHCKRVS
jgi:hypothetical protein